MANLPVQWTKHVRDDTAKKEIESSVRASVTLIDNLLRILNEELALIQRAETKLESYDAGYPFRQAFANGQKLQLQKIKDLFLFQRETPKK